FIHAFVHLLDLHSFPTRRSSDLGPCFLKLFFPIFVSLAHNTGALTKMSVQSMDVTYGTVWNDCLEVIREQVESENFNTWFKPIVPLRVDGDVLTIQDPSQFFYEWLEENYVPVLRKAIHTVLGPTGRLEYSAIVDSGNQTHPPVAVNYPNTLRRSAVNAPPADDYSPFTYKALNPQKINSRLNPNYTFDNFVEGDCNRLARSAGVAVAKKPGVTSFNPLMLYGGVGVGKTHLVQAIGNEIKNSLP